MVLNQAPNGLMILVSIDRCNVILFSTNYIMHIGKDFQLESTVYQDLMCDLSVPLIFVEQCIIVIYCIVLVLSCVFIFGSKIQNGDYLLIIVISPPYCLKLFLII